MNIKTTIEVKMHMNGLNLTVNYVLNNKSFVSREKKKLNQWRHGEKRERTEREKKNESERMNKNKH